MARAALSPPQQQKLAEQELLNISFAVSTTEMRRREKCVVERRETIRTRGFPLPSARSGKQVGSLCLLRVGEKKGEQR